jgi:hypothetical protein
LDKARKLKAGQWLDDGPPSYQRALFIKLEVNPFLRKRFGNSAVLDLAEEAAFQTFLRELQ